LKQSIRIIGGHYRGKKLHFPAIDGLRPTSDRIRETVFNWLMHDIRQARCLDTFAGSGALGFEAFSRGAASVVLIEHDPLAFSNLKQICTSFHSSNLTVLKEDAYEYVKQHAQSGQQPFDVIFLDPPFAKPHLLDCIPIFGQSPILKPGGLLYLETPHDMGLNSEIWETLKLKHAGQVCYALYRKIM